MEPINLLDGDTKLSLHQDPFKKTCVESIFIYIRKDGSITAKVEFKNGKTEGAHKIEGKDFALIVKQTQEFIDSL